MTAITLKMPEPLARRITATAKRQNRSRSELIREAIENYVDEERDVPPPSAYDLAAPFLGTVEGPADLATDATHMKGYGK